VSLLDRLLESLGMRAAARDGGLPATAGGGVDPEAQSTVMKLVVGLGNPGLKYAQTRHNVGFRVIERLAGRLGWSEHFQRDAREKFGALVLDGSLESGRVMLLEPLTYMNRSGESVQAASRFYQVAPENLLVMVDDIALPVGKIRLRAGGSHGGHNGLRDIQRVLGTDQYPRLRIGVDPPPPQVAGRDYVLGRFTEEQRAKIEPALDRSADAALCWLREGIGTAMNRYNAEA
jgi:peptidyl-tRNA hydrolase, PTH1 family